MSIMIGYSNAAEARPLIEAGLIHAKRAGSELVLLHHAKLRNSDAREGVDDEVKRLRQAREELKSIAEEVRQAGVACRVIVETSSEQDPLRGVLEHVRAQQPEMLVIGIRRRSRVGKLLLGSTAQDLLLTVDCPVLAVKTGRAKSS